MALMRVKFATDKFKTCSASPSRLSLVKMWTRSSWGMAGKGRSYQAQRLGSADTLHVLVAWVRCRLWPGSKPPVRVAQCSRRNAGALLPASAHPNAFTARAGTWSKGTCLIPHRVWAFDRAVPLPQRAPPPPSAWW